MKICAILVSLGVASTAHGQAADGESFLAKFRYGLELFHRLFDSESGAKFFANVFNDGHEARTGEDFANRLFAAIVESLSGNQQEMSVAGVRISVLVARWISDAFPVGESSSRGGRGRSFSPLDALLQRPQVRELVSTARDPKLTDNVLREASASGRECVELLVCKMSPFVRGMQRSLDFFLVGDRGSNGTERAAWARSKPLERMYYFLPGMSEFLENGDLCDERHPLCVY